MPMELRKRKTPPPPPPPRVKRTKSTADKADKPAAEKKAPAKRVKDAVVSSGEKVVAAVENAVAPATEDKDTKTTPAAAAKAAAKKTTEPKEPKEKKKTAAQEKKEAAAAEKKAAAEEKKAEKAAAAEAKKEAAVKAAEEKKESTAAAVEEEEKKDADEKPAEEAKADAKPAEEKKDIEQLKVGDTIPEDLAGVKTEEGESTTLKALLEKSDKGIIVFAYPAASTPGCTKQACHFRDSHAAFTTAGYAIYGLSGDPPKKNKSFVSSQKLNYTLLCDEEYTLHEAFGIKKTGAKKTTTERSVFAVGKDGKIALLQKGTPDGTWEAAKKFAGI